MRRKFGQLARAALIALNREDPQGLDERGGAMFGLNRKVTPQ
jgi:hypothetical protein